MIIWGENIVYFFSTEETNLFWTNKKFVLLNFYQQIIVISSQNNVQKYRTKRNEQIFMSATNKVASEPKKFLFAPTSLHHNVRAYADENN